MVKNDKERLGSGSGDGDDVLKHPFFANINVPNLLAKKIKPEYIPPAGDKYSVDGFDPAITAEDPTSDTIPPARLELIKKFDKEFMDFSN